MLQARSNFQADRARGLINATASQLRVAWLYIYSRLRAFFCRHGFAPMSDQKDK
jgi:hypothetical protein